MSTKVIFRAYMNKKGHVTTVIALFPETPSDLSGHCCMSYEHIGQHGGADYLGVCEDTRSATEQEYTPLLVELQRIGYDDLEICKRRTPQIRDVFSARLREYRKGD